MDTYLFRSIWNSSFVYSIAAILLTITAYAAQEKPSFESPGDACQDWAVAKPKQVKPTITVGGTNADIPAYTSHAIQIAVDALQNTGGTVQLSPGTYEIEGPIQLTTGISLIGAGKTTILHKTDGLVRPLAIDRGYGLAQVSVTDPAGFHPGMGVQIFDDNAKDCWESTMAKIIAVQDNILYLDTYLVKDYQSDAGGIVSTNGALIEAIDVRDIRVANLVIDGNKQTHPYQTTGCRSGAIYLHKAIQCTIDSVTVSDYNGDGISWQITENITVTDCEVSGCTNFGMHPGTGSPATTVKNCRIHHNGTDGIFVCWRVQNSLFADNEIYCNGQYGISIGHKDTDNLFENNYIHENARAGIYLREQTAQNGGHRNTFRNNIIEDNGTKETPGYGFYIKPITNDLTIENNIIRDTGKGLQKTGAYIEENTQNIHLKDNQMTGHAHTDIINKSKNK